MNKSNFITAITLVFLVFFWVDGFAYERSPKSKISRMLSYLDRGNGDVFVSLETNGGTCSYGYYIRQDRVGYENVHNMLTSAYDAEKEIYIYGEENKKWEYSDNYVCQIFAVEYKHTEKRMRPVLDEKGLESAIEEAKLAKERAIAYADAVAKLEGWKSLSEIEILSVDHHEQPVLGKYFNFNIPDVDAILGNKNWNNKNQIIINVRTGDIGAAVLWRTANKVSIGDGHGRWVENPVANQWKVGDRFIIISLSSQLQQNEPNLGLTGIHTNIKLEKKYLIQHWLSSREEETESNESKIFRPKNYKGFPSSRFRPGYIFHADGDLDWLYFSPVDAHHYKPGKWWFDSEKENIIHVDLGGRTESWEIVELTEQLLRISLI